MKTFRHWRWAILSVVCYATLASVAVITPWLEVLGEEKFNETVADPKAHAYRLATLIVALLGANAGQLKALLNTDVSQAKATNPTS